MEDGAAWPAGVPTTDAPSEAAASAVSALHVAAYTQRTNHLQCLICAGGRPCTHNCSFPATVQHQVTSACQLLSSIPVTTAWSPCWSILLPWTCPHPGVPVRSALMACSLHTCALRPSVHSGDALRFTLAFPPAAPCCDPASAHSSRVPATAPALHDQNAFQHHTSPKQSSLILVNTATNTRLPRSITRTLLEGLLWSGWCIHAVCCRLIMHRTCPSCLVHMHADTIAACCSLLRGRCCWVSLLWWCCRCRCCCAYSTTCRR